MAGLLVLVALLVWLFVCFKFSAALSTGIQSPLIKAIVASALFVALLVSPFTDEYLGNVQFKQYCQAADKVDVVGTITVSRGSALFTDAGQWKIEDLKPAQYKERRLLDEEVEKLVRWEHGTSAPTESIFPIQESTTKIVDLASGRLLAQWKSYYFKGGFLRRGLFDSSSQCFPKEANNAIHKRLLVPERP